MNWESEDWVDHASFGIGQVCESRADWLDKYGENDARKYYSKFDAAVLLELG